MFRIIPEGLGYREHVLLKDGPGVLLRPATPGDVSPVRSFMGRVSRESLRQRFMAAVAEVSEAAVRDLCSGDFTEQGCLLAVVAEAETERVVGLGNFVGVPNRRAAEVAFLVEDAFQGRGISTLLLERLAGLAAAAGFVTFEAEVLTDNQRMLSVFKASGFELHRVWGGDTVHLELPVDGAVALRERGELRERVAAANSLVPLLRPKVVAVVGASRDPQAIGHMVFRNILQGRFAGTVYPVNPQAAAVDGVKAYPTITDLPDPPDLAVIALPAEAVQEAAEAAVRAGARGLVVMSAGFAEAGPEGAERQRQLVELVRAHGVRLVGPSCLGFMNTHPEVLLNSSLAPKLAPRGPVGFFSHSAALGLVILDAATDRGIGFSTFVSAGNRADVSGNDLLQYWEEDPDTEVALLYLETFGNPRRFARVARRVAATKPVLCVKGARSLAGRRASEARSGLPGAGEAEVEALFDQTGVIRAATLEELFDVAVLLAHQPLPRGNRVAVVANSAGVTTLLADACEAHGLELGAAAAVNLGAFTSARRYHDTVRELLADDAVDSLIVAFACVGDCRPDEVTAAVGSGVQAAAEASGTPKPVLVCIMGAVGAVPAVDGDRRRALPAYRFPESAPRALARVVHYAEQRRQPPGRLAWYDDVDPTPARQEVLAALSQAQTGPVPLGAQAAGRVLEAFGLSTGNCEGHAVAIRVRPDPLFGPIVELEGTGGQTLVRLTPLTDRDIEAVLVQAHLDDSPGVGEVLGRLSQLVEELPWVWSLEVGAVAGERPVLALGAAITVRRVASSQASRP